MQDTKITITVKAKDVETIKKHYRLPEDATDQQIKQQVTLFYMLRGLSDVMRIQREEVS